MKARNLFLSFLAILTMSWAGVALADDASMPSQPAATVNINEADAATLADVLDGVGLRRAEAIVLYRQANGKFYSAEELTAVKGIGKTTVARNQQKIAVD